MKARLLAHWRAADDATREAGRGWYATAEAEARELSRALPPGLGPVAAAGILAALSPRAQWSVNVRWARAIAENPAAPVSTLGNRAKARAIAEGTRPAHVLSGPKVRAFWRAIAGDPEAAVLDVWMFRAMGLPEQPSPSLLREAEAALREAAEHVGETVRDFQATIWLQVRGVKPTDGAGYRPAQEVE